MKNIMSMESILLKFNWHISNFNSNSNFLGLYTSIKYPTSGGITQHPHFYGLI